jgi:dienelactone hydrolase
MKLAALIICLISLAAAGKAQAPAEWEKFADGSAGRIEAFQGVGGTQIPAYIRKPAGQGPFPAVVFLHGNMSSKEDTYRMGRSTGHPTEDFVQAGWAVYSIDFRPNPPLTTDPREWEDTALAIRQVRQMPFIDGERVSVEGSSHGANTLSRMISRERIRCAVLCAPAAIDLIEVSHAVARGEKVNPQLTRWIAAVEKRSGAKMDEIEKNPAIGTSGSRRCARAGQPLPDRLGSPLSRIVKVVGAFARASKLFHIFHISQALS